MAAQKGTVTLRGRFSPGVRVRLVKVASERVLRAVGEEVDAKVVDKDGCVSFPADVGARYFVAGIQNGSPLEVRARGRAADDPSELETAPVGPDRVRLSDGSFLDEPPEQHQKPDVPEGATWPGQHQVPEGTIQRSDTPRGAATPISADELERAQRGHRKQEPTEPVVESDAVSAPARTARPRSRSTTAKAKG